MEIESSLSVTLTSVFFPKGLRRQSRCVLYRFDIG